MTLSSVTTIFFKQTPFIRLLVPLSAGMLLQQQLHIGYGIILMVITAALLLAITFEWMPLFQKFRYSSIKGIVWQFLFAGVGMMLFTVKDIRFNSNWLGHHYSSNIMIIAKLKEAPVQKENSYRAEAAVEYIYEHGRATAATGGIIIYFKKDSSALRCRLGSQIAFKKTLQPIKNSGNPGSFNYQQYAFFNGLTHQVFLTQDDYILSGRDTKSTVTYFLNTIRDYVLQTIKTYIPGKKERGLAAALLIGYKNEVDSELLQAYSNTGIVHVIAVSGMHLALIFWVLHLLFKPLLKNKKTKWLYSGLILWILWLFTLVTGGAASIVRASVMFTFIVIGRNMQRKTSVYNSLAASAFCLLIYNPYWLWDVGFQLSYAAVLSIVLFYKPIYNLLHIRNRSLDWMWKLVAVSTSAQILTTPAAVYHFHQFPVYFLLTNLLVVPVSSIVLIGELFLVAISPIPGIAVFTGKTLSSLIWWMNSFIEGLSSFPFAVWQGLQINGVQVLLLYISIAGAAVGLMAKRKTGLWISLLAFLGFMAIRMFSFYTASQQQQIIVYNIYRHTAISFIHGRSHKLITDANMHKNNLLYNRYVKPAITLYRLKPATEVPGLIIKNKSMTFSGKKIWLLDEPVTLTDSSRKITIDLLILSGNPRLSISDLQKIILPQKIIISGDVPAWKAEHWRKDCDSLHLSYHDVAIDGAYIMNLH